MGRFVGVANSYMYLVFARLFLSDGFLSSSVVVHQSLDCFVVVVICGWADNGSVRHWVLCVFCRKYMCGVDVLDKDCGGIF